MIETRSEITIDSTDRWIYQGNEITQPDVLRYFRQILRRSDKGWFLENRFGDLLEHGFIESAHGFPIHALSATFSEDRITFQLDSGEIVQVPHSDVFLAKVQSEPDDSNCLFFLIPDTNIPVRLSPSAMVQTAERIENQGSVLRWKSGKEITIKDLDFFF